MDHYNTYKMKEKDNQPTITNKGLIYDVNFFQIQIISDENYPDTMLLFTYSGISVATVNLMSLEKFHNVIYILDFHNKTFNNNRLPKNKYIILKIKEDMLHFYETLCIN